MIYLAYAQRLLIVCIGVRHTWIQSIQLRGSEFWGCGDSMPSITNTLIWSSWGRPPFSWGKRLFLCKNQGKTLFLFSEMNYNIKMNLHAWTYSVFKNRIVVRRVSSYLHRLVSAAQLFWSGRCPFSTFIWIIFANHINTSEYSHGDSRHLSSSFCRRPSFLAVADAFFFIQSPVYTCGREGSIITNLLQGLERYTKFLIHGPGELCLCLKRRLTALTRNGSIKSVGAEFPGRHDGLGCTIIICWRDTTEGTDSPCLDCTVFEQSVLLCLMHIIFQQLAASSFIWPVTF